MPCRTHAPMRTAATIALLALVPIGGCNSVKTIAPPAPAGASGDVPHRQIVANGWLHDKASVKAVREELVNGDLRRVAVDVYNDQRTQRRFSYRFDWIDAAGMPIGGPTASLRSAVIKPRETIVIVSTAPSPMAAQWRLTLLDAHD